MMTMTEKAQYIRDLAGLAIDYPDKSADIFGLLAAAMSGTNTSPEPTVSELAAFVHEGKIAAIKAHRARTNMGLKDSKDTLEAAAGRLGIKAPEFNWTPKPLSEIATPSIRVPDYAELNEI